MNKRHLITAIVLALVLAVTASVALADTYYVKTGDGKTVNVRYTDQKGYEILARLKYGSKVDVMAFTKNGTWAMIHYKGKTMQGESYDGDAYVMSEFLVPYKPEPYQGKSSGSSKGSSSSSQQTGASNSSLNAIFAKAKFVDPYTVTVRPTRASGQVNVRWAPSKSSQLLRAFPSGTQLTVITEFGTDWFQVEDPDTGIVGFLNKAYIVK